MGCRKLTYYETPTVPLKVVQGKGLESEKVVQGFISVDPLADKFPAWTPYKGFMNNPITYTDPDGREEVCESCPENEERFNIYRESEFEFKYNDKTGLAERVNPDEKINIDQVKDPLLELTVFMSEAYDNQHDGDLISDHITSDKGPNDRGQLQRTYRKDDQLIDVMVALDSPYPISSSVLPRSLVSENPYRGKIDLTLFSMYRENPMSSHGPVRVPLIQFNFAKDKNGALLLQRITKSL